MRNALISTTAAFLAACLLPVPAAAGPPLYTISVSVNPEAGGTVTLDPMKDGYQKNNVVTLSATPNDDYCFSGWSGDLGGTQNPITLRVSGNHDVTAHFGTGTACGGGGGTGGGDTTPVPAPTGLLPTEGMIVGYFAQWTIYRRGYLPKHVFTSGALENLNVINYAFAAADANGLCASLDTFADWGKRFDADESVDGVADTVSQPLKGNFNQLIKLKAKNPALRILISLGGWTESYRFSAIASSQAGREKFVKSCIDMFIKGHFADGIDQPGIFDGIDVDWEYPGSCGATCDYSEADRENFVALLEEFRTRLDLQATADGRDYLLTIAAPAGQEHYEPIDMAAIEPSLDWINVMTYDFHGSWEPRGPANHASALYPSRCEPAGGNWADKAIRAYLGHVPASKLLLGMPFYGHGWRGVAAVNDGLCQPAGGVPRGTYEKGVDDYEVLAASGDTDSWDEATGTHWTFDGNEFWSFDDAISAEWKADYANCNGLRGVMFWELSGDDPAGTLLEALATRLGHASSGCRDAWPDQLAAEN
jgi:chitinase